MTDDMTPDELRTLAEEMLGGRWQSALARILRVEGRTVRAWASGERPISPLVAGTIAMLSELADFAASTAQRSNKLSFRRVPGGFLFPAQGTRRNTITLSDVPDVLVMVALSRLLLRHPNPKPGSHFRWRDL